MKKTIVLLIAVSALAACGDDSAPPVGPDAKDIDAPDNPPAGFVQVEHLARPGINEVFIITEAFHQGYNATAPAFNGVPNDTLTAIVNEVKVVMKALYLGTCLLNGVAGLNAQNGLHPGGLECHAVGAAVFEADGETQTAASITASQAYADAVFGLFIPDVMRVDTSVTSNYETLCGAGPVGLCGGRFVRDDVIDTTYDFLLNGAATPKGAYSQVTALVSDGVHYDPSLAGNNNNVNDNINTDATSNGNTNQGHPQESQGFPYSAAPF